MYVKTKSYTLNQFGEPIAFVMIKIHILTFIYKAEITLVNGKNYELYNQWALETEFDLEIEKFTRNKINQ